MIVPRVMMISSVHRVVLVILALCFFLDKTVANIAHKRHKHSVGNKIPDIGIEVEKENKLLIECQNEDYRTYIKCLKREKRQHFDELGNTKRNCLNECFEANCTTTHCIQDCHRRCRTRLTYTKTVETTYDCNHEGCNSNGDTRTPNITTNIHIQNVLPNDTILTPLKNYTVPKIEIHNIINNSLGPGSTQDCACPCNSGGGCCCNNNNNNPYSNNNNNNPWSMMPQITIGFGGGGPFGGCMFSPWLCLQKYPVQQPTIDCSICLNPIFKIRCDPSCFTHEKDTTQSNTINQKSPSSPQSSRNQRNQ